MEESRAPHLLERGRTCRLVAIVFASVSAPMRQFVAAPVGGGLETTSRACGVSLVRFECRRNCREEVREQEFVFAGLSVVFGVVGSREQKAGRRAFRSIQECPVARVKRKSRCEPRRRFAGFALRPLNRQLFRSTCIAGSNVSKVFELDTDAWIESSLHPAANLSPARPPRS